MFYMARTPAKTTSRSAHKKPRRESVYSVAKLAGVSPGTVSRVLNNRDRVNSETRRQVLKAARSVGFKAPVRTRQIALISSDRSVTLKNSSYRQALTAQISLALCRSSMTMVMPQGPLDRLDNVFLDGVVVIGACPEFEPLIAKFSQHTPVVFIDDFPGNADRYTVRSDHYMAGQLAAEHFARTGRKKMAYVSAKSNADDSRLAGYRETLTKAGLDYHEELFVQRNQEVSFYAAISRVVRLGADALFVPGSSYESLEALNVMNNVMRLRVPEQIALIGGEVPQISEFLTPPMTTVEEPLAEMANQTIDMLTTLMKGEKPTQPQLTLPVRFLGRESA
jgi:DNA-binding LacI/PurR family transcriptional regulator